MPLGNNQLLENPTFSALHFMCGAQWGRSAQACNYLSPKSLETISGTSLSALVETMAPSRGRYHPSDMTPARNNGQTCFNGLKPFLVQCL